MLDAQEYLHLAVNASQQGEHHAAMEHLHKCLESEPDNAYAVYLLAAEHAEIGLFDRALEGMERAIELDDSIEMAKFQLGLLYVRLGNDERAKQFWTILVDNTEDESLRLFSESLLALLGEDLALAQSKFEAGRELNKSNPGLNDSMARILEVATSGSVDTAPVNESAAVSAKKDESKNDPVFLGAYKDHSLDED